MFTLVEIAVIATLTHSCSVSGQLTQLLLERGPNLKSEGFLSSIQWNSKKTRYAHEVGPCSFSKVLREQVFKLHLF